MSDRKPSVVKQYKDLEPGDVYLALGIPNDPEHAWTPAQTVVIHLHSERWSTLTTIGRTPGFFPWGKELDALPKGTVFHHTDHTEGPRP